MADFNLPTETGTWGYVQGLATEYASARSSGNGGIVGLTGSVGQFWTGTYYKINRALLIYDTSSLGSGATIAQANLVWTTPASATGIDLSTTDFSVTVMKLNWTTFNATHFANIASADVDGVLLNTADFAYETTFTSANLDTTRINKTGNTTFGLISSRDLSETAPTGNEYLKDCKPVLSITLGGANVTHSFALLGVGR